MIKKCPKCKNTGWVINPNEQFKDSICEFCSGLGTVDDEFVCSCGRPISRLVDGKEICGSVECEKKLTEVVNDIPKSWLSDEQDWDNWNKFGFVM